MNLLLTLRIAFRAIAKNKLRAALTVLGVVIGIAAVTTMVSIGQSANALVQNELQSFGANFLVVIPRMQRRGGVPSERKLTLTKYDATELVEKCDSVMASSPLVGAGGQVTYGSQSTRPSEMLGVGVDYLTVKKWPLMSGSFFSEADISSGSKVCVLGVSVAKELFQTADPLDKIIHINNIPFRVTGVLEETGFNMTGGDRDNVLFMPYSAARMELQGSRSDNVDAILVAAKSREQVIEAQEEISLLLAERHDVSPDEPNDFSVEIAVRTEKKKGGWFGRK